MKVLRQIIIVCAMLICSASFVLYLLNLKKNDNVTPTVVTERYYYYDSTPKDIPVPQAPASVSVKTVAVPANINYDSIAKYFFAMYTYSQVIEDTAIRVKLIDTISQNRIQGRKFTYQLLKPVRIVESTTVTLPAQKRLLFGVGGFAEVSANLTFGPRLTLTTKKDWQFGYDFGVADKSHRFAVVKQFGK
jgi:hypothetical protein